MARGGPCDQVKGQGRFVVSWVRFPRDLVVFFVCNGPFSGNGDVIVHVVFVDLWGKSGKGKVW